MSFLLAVRNAARLTTDEPLRQALKAAGDNLDTALTALHETVSTEAMVCAVGCWAYADKLLKKFETGGDGTNGGSVRGVVLQQDVELKRAA